MCLHCAAHTSCSQEEVGSANWALQRREAERHALTFGWFMGAMGCERHHRDRCCHAPVRVLCALQKQSPPPQDSSVPLMHPCIGAFSPAVFVAVVQLYKKSRAAVVLQPGLGGQVVKSLLPGTFLVQCCCQQHGL